MSIRLKNEDYVPIGEIVLNNFSNDQPDFLKFYKSMNEDYRNDFEQALDKVKTLESSHYLRLKEQTTLTKALYAKCDETADRLQVLSSYLEFENLDCKKSQEASTAFRKRNVEGGVRSGKEVLIYASNSESLLAKNMPDDFLSQLSTMINDAEAMNLQQNDMLLQRTKASNDDRVHYDELYRYISEVCKAGKIVYKKDPAKKAQYTLSKIKALLSAGTRS